MKKIMTQNNDTDLKLKQIKEILLPKEKISIEERAKNAVKNAFEKVNQNKKDSK